MIANALIHADYHGRRGVVVERRPDRLTTMNPGSFRVPIDQAVRGGRSDPRNPTVMKMLMLTGMVERAGSGMSVIMGACRELGAGTPKFTEETDPDTVTCTMPISPSSSGCVTERVLSMIVRDNKASINSMSDALGVPRSEVVGAVNSLKAADYSSGNFIRVGCAYDIYLDDSLFQKVLPGFVKGVGSYGGDVLGGSKTIDAVGLALAHYLLAALLRVAALVVELALDFFQHKTLLLANVMGQERAVHNVRLKDHVEKQIHAVFRNALVGEGEAVVDGGKAEP